MEMTANSIFHKPGESFAFGLEAKFPLVNLSGAPQWHQELSFQRLYDCLSAIPSGDWGTPGLKLEPPHKTTMPYVVEGYHLPNPEFEPIDLLPKGVEIRTPLALDLKSCLTRFEVLYDRMQSALRKTGLQATTVSHHPTGNQFSGPQNKRRHDFWQWAMEAMHTYGPDINVSLPLSLNQQINLADLEAKSHYYGPALAAISLNSPFLEGKPWTIRGKQGKSIRLYRRSPIAPAVELHPDQGGRLEFKVFEMSPYLGDYECFFLLWLTLILDSSLQGRASRASYIYGMGEVAVDGLELPWVQDKIEQVLESAFRVLPNWGFDPAPLKALIPRVQNKRHPADLLLAEYESSKSLEKTLLGNTLWRTEENAIEFRPRPYRSSFSASDRSIAVTE